MPPQYPERDEWAPQCDCPTHFEPGSWAEHSIWRILRFLIESKACGTGCIFWKLLLVSSATWSLLYWERPTKRSCSRSRTSPPSERRGTERTATLTLQDVPEGSTFTGKFEGKYNFPNAKPVPARYWHPCVIRNGELMETSAEDFGPDLYAGYLIDFIKHFFHGPEKCTKTIDIFCICSLVGQ